MRGKIHVQTHYFEDDGAIPNNPKLPLLIYEGALDPGQRSHQGCKALFNRHDWGNDWLNGVFDFHHYHSVTHEVLGVISGSATLAMGGPQGITIEVKAGDVLLIPAGVGHCNKGASDDFRVVGAYPDGHNYDMCYGKPEERPEKLENIKKVPLPSQDPVAGEKGPVHEIWRKP